MKEVKRGILTLTKNGIILADQLRSRYKPFHDADIYLPARFRQEIKDYNLYTYKDSLSEEVGRIFLEYTQLVFIMALGIVIRVVSPYLKDKRSDPAVVTIDEAGSNIISTLSGHLGGANQLTEEIACSLKGNPVITTATDVQGKIAFDLFAQTLGCQIIPFANLKLANAAVVNDRRINIFTDDSALIKRVLKERSTEKIKVYPLVEMRKRQDGFSVIISNRQLEVFTQDYLQLVPKNLIIGVGCRRGVKKEQVKAAVDHGLNKLNLKREGIKRLATIDLKSDERAINQYALSLGVKVDIIERAEIKKIDFKYSTSPIVLKRIGVGGVCEPAALLSAKKGRLLLKKTILNDVTVAIVEERGE